MTRNNWDGVNTKKLHAFHDAYQIAAEEKKSLGPTKEQQGLADLLDSIGEWPLFVTFTFRPNKYEEILQSKDGTFYRNENLSFSNVVIKGKRRGYQGKWESGGITRGTPNIAPGWSPGAAESIIKKFILKDRELKKTRWFETIEGSKYRNCAHGHGLFGNASHVNWNRVDAKWQEQYGRFRVEVVDTKNGMACYLAKQYMGKSYGTERCRFSFSHNSRAPKADPVPQAWYAMRMAEYKKFCAKNGSKETLGSLNEYARKRRKGQP